MDQCAAPGEAADGGRIGVAWFGLDLQPDVSARARLAQARSCGELLSCARLDSVRVRVDRRADRVGCATIDRTGRPMFCESRAFRPAVRRPKARGSSPATESDRFVDPGSVHPEGLDGVLEEAWREALKRNALVTGLMDWGELTIGSEMMGKISELLHDKYLSDEYHRRR